MNLFKRLSIQKPKLNGDDNGFVRDSDQDGLVYQPVEQSGGPPMPLKQSKSSTTLIDATIRAEMRLRRLMASANIILEFCGLDSELLYGSEFLLSYSRTSAGCEKCYKTNNVRIAHYFNETTAPFGKNQEVSDLIDVNHCDEIVSTTPKPYIDCPPKPSLWACAFGTADPYLCCKQDQEYVCGECRKG